MKKIISLAVVFISLTLPLRAQKPELFDQSTSHFDDPIKINISSYPSQDLFRIYKKGRTGASSLSRILDDLQSQIKKFAKKKGKGYLILGQRTSTGPYIFGNFPRAEIVFALVPEGKQNQGQVLPASEKGGN